MAYFNPNRVDFNYNTNMIDAVGAVGRSLWDIYKENVAKNQNQMKINETMRSNLASEALTGARDAETARHNLTTEAETASNNAFTQKFKQSELAEKVKNWNNQALHYANQDKIGMMNANTSLYNADTSRMNANTQAQRLEFDKNKQNDQDLQDAILAKSRANLLNETDAETAALIGVTPQNLELIKNNLKQQGFNDEQIERGINQHIRTQIASLGGTYWNNPLSQQEIIETRKTKNQEVEDSILSAKSLLKENSGLREKIGKKYGVDVGALDDANLDAILRNEMKSGGGLNPKIISASTKNLKPLADNISTIKLASTISNIVSDGAQKETGWFGLTKPANSVAQFLNSDSQEATNARVAINTLRAKMAKTARSNAVLQALQEIMPKYGDPSTQNFLSTLTAAAHLAYTDIDAAIATLPNGVYSDNIEAELKNLDALSANIERLTGISPKTLEPTSAQQRNVRSEQVAVSGRSLGGGNIMQVKAGNGTTVNFR